MFHELMRPVPVKVFKHLRFENSVILNGTKTDFVAVSAGRGFENSVILNGTKTVFIAVMGFFVFENSVILNGTKT